jgi:membrane-anchored glycerophosphoryl diester phosphodiesterase (GDPDase)
MFGAVILLAIAGIVGGMIFGLIFGAVSAGLNSGVLTVLLAIASLVLAIYLYARLSMLTPVIAIDEERNPIRAISRSWTMTGPAVLKIALVIALAAIVACLAVLVLVFATIGTAALSGQPPSPGGLIAFGLGMIAFAVTVGLYFNALFAAIHRQVSGGGAAQASAAFE